jgi:hypothetical protein
MNNSNKYVEVKTALAEGTRVSVKTLFDYLDWIFKYHSLFSPLMLCIHTPPLTITLQANG